MDKMIVPEETDNRAITLRPIGEREHQRFACDCPMCESYEHQQVCALMKQQENGFRERLAMRADQPFTPTHLQAILKHLLLPSNKIVKRGIEVFVPEICYFDDGEAVSFYFTRDVEDYHLVRLRKDKITHTTMQKIFNERRRNYRERIKRALQLTRDESKREEPKQKWKKKNQPKGNRNDNLNNVIVRFTDGCETLTSENQLLSILGRRKQDPFWKKVYSIRNYVHPYFAREEASNMFDIAYDRNQIQYKALHERAQQLMLTYSQRELPTSQFYISDENETAFCQKLKKESLLVFSTYTFYKIAAYISCFADEQINEAKAKMMVNQLGNCYLLDVYSLSIKPLVKYSWTNEIYHQMVQTREIEKYHKKKLHTNEKTIAKSNLIESFMESEYEVLKKRYGVTVEPQEDVNEKLNNQFFAFLYPAVNQDLSDLVKLNIPLQTFRRKFMGQKEERKPLFKPFNSKFVRQLHRLTPGPRKSLMVNSQEKGGQASQSWRGRTVSHFWNTIST